MLSSINAVLFSFGPEACLLSIISCGYVVGNLVCYYGIFLF